MAKDYKHASLICGIITILALAGIIAGILLKKPLIIIIAMLPAAGYEVYRTEGIMTKLASVGILGLAIGEIFFIFTKVQVNIGKIIGISAIPIKGRSLSLGDITTVVPIIIILLSILLVKKTGGKYTIWLAIVILVTSAGLLYVLNTDIVSALLKSGVPKGITR